VCASKLALFVRPLGLPDGHLVLAFAFPGGNKLCPGVIAWMGAWSVGGYLLIAYALWASGLKPLGEAEHRIYRYANRPECCGCQFDVARWASSPDGGRRSARIKTSWEV
jgi:hypothetical protein